MGEPARSVAISHAGSRPAAYTNAARSALGRFARDESGATAIEYAIMAAGIAVMVVGAINAVGQGVKSAFFDHIAAAMTH
ncbi:MAG TPA: Flp family type IVb pilin [Rhizomicrobium sp.]|nr:Flp family type IVb pilin [Rhizomicrobium sp.]